MLTAFVKAGLVASTGEARRQIKAGGLRVNDAAVTDEKAALGEKDLADGVVKLSLGKKKHVLLESSGGNRTRRQRGAGPLSGSRPVPVPSKTPNTLRNRPGAITDSGLTVSTGALKAPLTRKLTANIALVLAAGEHHADDRNIRHEIIEPIGRHEGARHVDAVARHIDIAVHGEADLRPRHHARRAWRAGRSPR